MKKALFILLSATFLSANIQSQELKTTELTPTDDTYIYGGIITDHTPGRLKTAPYTMGAAVTVDKLRNNQRYREAIAREYNSITAENAMKMGSIWQSRERYNFRDVDYLVNFAEENHLRVHGHCLIWYKSSTATAMPDFIKELHRTGWGTKEEWKELMKEYITTVMERYKGRIASWDVVNESIQDDGKDRGNDDIWSVHIGFPEYLEWAFECAHEADPDAILFYNDFGYDYSSAKRETTDRVLQNLIRKGVPIHGYGIQSHITLANRKEGEFKTQIERAGKLGIYIHISELDINCNTNGDSSVTFTDELARKQAGLFNEVAASMKNLPEDQQYGITFWSVADASSGAQNRPDWPYVLGLDYLPKTPAYDYFVKGFSGIYIPWNEVKLNP